MNVVIIGGNDCMTHQYKAICKEYACEAKIFTHPKKSLERLIGRPDLIVLFTRPVAHEMIEIAKREAVRKHIKLCQSHSASASALRNILEQAGLQAG
ncbi:MAG: DUF2325 domain-containing protein [Spirochaetaceae bacterium]|nr:DUF2325 domain-containing protein [Spirochaetaceae bacterium]